MREVKGPDLLKQSTHLFSWQMFLNKIPVDSLRAKIVYVKKPNAGECNGLAGVYGETGVKK